jgi:hypothetical protein
MNTPDCNQTIAPYLYLMSDCVNLSHILWNNHGNKRLFFQTKDNLTQKVIPNLCRLTTQYADEISQRDEEEMSNAFIVEYESLIQSGKFKEAESFSRDWLRYMRGDARIPSFRMI